MQYPLFNYLFLTTFANKHNPKHVGLITEVKDLVDDLVTL